MEAFTSLRAKALPIDIANCDTDQIIPARFLRRAPEESGYDHCLFHDLRFDDSGGERAGFIFNQPIYKGARIIVADVNWGCGSSREAAVYALVANGIKAVIAPSFGDIHHSNCMKHGVLPVRLPREACDALRAQIHDAPGAEVGIDLAAQVVTGPDGATYDFEVASFDKHRMLNGLDDIGLTHEYEADIAAFEERHFSRQDWLH